MSHLTDRAIVELRDGAPLAADSRTHLNGCEACRRALEEAETRAADIASALTDLDERFDGEAAREAVRARLVNGRASAGLSRERKARASFWTLGRAATFLILATGALSALPGSPLREWVSGGEPEASAATELAPAVGVEPVGIRMTVEDGPLVVELDKVPSGTPIEVRWVEGRAVTVFAAPGSSFSSGEGRVRATIAGGPVAVELPKSTSGASLMVNGRMYARRSAGGVDVSGPVDERDPDRIRFIVP